MSRNSSGKKPAKPGSKKGRQKTPRTKARPAPIKGRSLRASKDEEE